MPNTETPSRALIHARERWHQHEARDEIDPVPDGSVRDRIGDGGRAEQRAVRQQRAEHAARAQLVEDLDDAPAVQHGQSSVASGRRAAACNTRPGLPRYCSAR